MINLQCFNYNGQIIQQREDGYINLTQMCQANNTRIGHFLENKSTKEHLKALEPIVGIPYKELYTITKGGDFSVQGTWGHPAVAIALARWISPVFSAWFDTQIASKVDCDFSTFVGKTTVKDYSGFVYLIKSKPHDLYKIGMSKEPYKRMLSLQTGTPFELKIVHRIFAFDCVQLESALHDHYSAYWVRGEWFELPPKEVSNFLNVANSLASEETSGDGGNDNSPISINDFSHFNQDATSAIATISTIHR